MKIDRILLVNAPLDDVAERKQAVNDRSFPPLGLMTIATRLKLSFPDIQVRILDGDLLSEEEIENIIESFQLQIVGLSVLTPTYESALRIATYSRAVGVPYVVLGNDHASFFPERILEKRDDISFVTSGDNGDIDFIELVRAISTGDDPFASVTNLHGRHNGKIVSSRRVNYRLTEKLSRDEFWPDPSLIESSLYSQYEENYSQRFGYLHTIQPVRPFIINNAKGCYKKDDRCLYCSIFDLSYQWGDAQVFWRAIETYHKQHGFNFFFEVCDNFGPLKPYRRELIRYMPSWFADSEIQFMVYTDANVIRRNPDLIDDLKRLHVLRVNMGLDSGDSRELAILKGFKNGDLNRKAVEILTSSGIQIHCSFVLGSLGEIEQSLASTVEFVEELLTNPGVVAIEVSPLFPLPSSPAWAVFLGQTMYFRDRRNLEQLLEQACINKDIESAWKETRKYFQDNDVINLTMASKLWGDHFTHVGYDAVLNVAANLNIKIEASGKICGGFA